MVPPTFEPPERVVTDRFVIRPLLYSDAEPDYDAWSTSIEHLQGAFGPESDWPTADMTLEKNVIDLGWYQREHESGASFTFTVFDTDDRRCLGCIYLSPARKQGYDAEAYYWVRASEVASGLDDALGDFVRNWVPAAWPFRSVLFPGRDIDWQTYLGLPENEHW